MDKYLDGSTEIRARMIEAAAKHPHSTHKDGHAAGVLAAAMSWYSWVVGPAEAPFNIGQDAKPETMREKLGLPKKK